MVMRQVAHHIEHTRDRCAGRAWTPTGIQMDYGKL
jgi:hypothetical protein